MEKQDGMFNQLIRRFVSLLCFQEQSAARLSLTEEVHKRLNVVHIQCFLKIISLMIDLTKAIHEALIHHISFYHFSVRYVAI